MKKLTKSVLAVVLSASFSMSYAQKSKADTLKTKDIGEVVITGALGIKKKADAQTSAQQVVTNEQLTQAANPNAISALTGKVSGVQITQTNTSVTGTQSIIIRGPRSITGNNEALVVIDNVISSATVLQQLPPELIESINVIKGAAGAALYGSQGINGAVVVTTKRGTKSKKITTTLNSAVDFEKIAFMPLRQREYGQGWDGHKIGVENGGWGPAYSDPAYGGKDFSYGPGLKDVDGNGSIDYDPSFGVASADDASAVRSTYAPYGKDNVKDFFQTGSILQNTLTVNAGDSDAYVLMSLNNLEREFVVQDDIQKRIGGLFKAGIKLGKWRFDGSLNYIRRKTSVTDSDIYHQLLQSASDVPITKFKDFADRGYAWNVYYTNPYFYIKHDRHNQLSNYFNFIGSAEYQLNKNINFLYRGNIQYTGLEVNNYGDGWSDPLLHDLSSIQSYYNKSKYNAANYYGDFLANFDYDLTDDLNFKLTVGHNYQEWRTDASSAGGTGIIIPGIYQVWNLTNQTLPWNLDNTRSFRNMHAFLGNLDLDYKGYLFLNASGRYEMSSVLPTDSRGYFFPAVSASFVPTKAFSNLKSDILNYLKITAALQRTGNTSAIGVYDVYNRMNLGYGYPYDVAGPTGGGLSFVIDQTQTSPNIKPEFTTKKELGVVAGFLNDRISLDVSLYREDTKDLITRQTASNASGITSNLINIGALYNKGIDASLNLVPVKNSDLKWELGVSYTTNKTVVTKVTDDADEVLLGGNNFVGVYAIKGEEFPIIKGTTYNRDPQGRIIVDGTTGLPTVSSTLQKIGRVTPKYILGFTTSLSYKGFKFAATMDYRTGHKFYSGTLQGFTFNGMNVASAGFDRTKPYIIPNSVILTSPGVYSPNTTVGIYQNNLTAGSMDTFGALESYFGGSNYNSVGENFILDATAFKVRELSLSYSFAKNLLAGTKINELTVGVHARNPFYKFASDNKGYDDPETSFSQSVRGLANPNQYPNLKSYGASVTISF